MDAIISEKCEGLEGEINSSPSKSYSHRAFFLGFLLPPHSQVLLDNVLDEGDVSHTINACRKLGASITKISDRRYKILPPPDLISPNQALDCGNSGTTVRILISLSILIKGTITLTGDFFELERPIDDLINAMKPLGTTIKLYNDPETNKKKLDINTPNILSNNIKIRGDVSSQYITALIITACGLYLRQNLLNKKKFDHDEFIIETTTPVKSFPYVLITKKIVKLFGIDIKIEKFDDNRIKAIIPTKSYTKINNQNIANVIIPGDFSSAAFIIAGGSLFGKINGIKINKIDITDPQGDKKIIQYLENMGATIKNEENSLIICGRKEIFDKNGDFIKKLNGIVINDCSDTPDLFPILCVIGAFSEGKTEIRNIEHIRLKETDRVAVMVRELKKFNVDIEEFKDKVVINGMNSYLLEKDIIVETEEDHRIIMAMCIFAIGLIYKSKKIQILHTEHVEDSYPDFFNHLKKLKYEIIIC
ncbi:MAG: 3-phosphoshikimate 1-carboxyvinyltransferase [archaeon]|nr:3-phosphoshikimate 1-carboxyvinyltransferase [archaeon]